MNADTQTTGSSSLRYDVASHLAWARAAVDGLVRRDLRPSEVLLALVLVRGTLLSGVTVGKVDLESWAQELGMESRKLRVFWRELVRLGAVDHDVGRGTYQVRPDAASWLPVRGERSRTDPSSLRYDATSATRELPLRVERELEEARNQVSREAVGPPSSDSGAASPRVADLVAALRAAVECPESGPAEFSASGPENFSTGPAEFSAALLKVKESPVTIGPNGAAEFSAGSLASLASNRKEASLAKAPAYAQSYGAARLEVSDGGQAELREVAWRWVQELDGGRGRLQPGGRGEEQWKRLCWKRPEWVMGHLRKRLAKAGATDGLAYAGAVARREGMFR